MKKLLLILFAFISFTLQSQVAVISGGVPEDGLDSYLISHWTLNETSGVSSSDSINSNNGTPSGGLVIADDYVTGYYSYALDFNYVTVDYISVAYDATLLMGTDNFTISAYIKLGRVSQYQTIFAIRNSSIDSKIVLRVRNTNDLQFWCQDNTNPYNFAVSDTATFSTATWYHVAGVRSGDTLKVYIDGQLKGVDYTNTLSNINTDGIDLVIGRAAENLTSNYFDGVIDDIRFYSKALTEDEISTL